MVVVVVGGGGALRLWSVQDKSKTGIFPVEMRQIMD